MADLFYILVFVINHESLTPAFEGVFTFGHHDLLLLLLLLLILLLALFHNLKIK